jgi:hypothetical protein
MMPPTQTTLRIELSMPIYSLFTPIYLPTAPDFIIKLSSRNHFYVSKELFSAPC